MHPKIVETFWSDLDFDRFQGQELANVRLTFLWAITSPTTNSAGIFPCTRRVFCSDTGLEFDWLTRTMDAFPRSFTYDTESRHALLRRYVRYQIGAGDSLVSNWRMCTKLLKDLRNSPLTLSAEVVALHPELGRAVDRFGKPLLSPSEALAKGLPSPSTDLNAESPCEALTKPLQTQQNQASGAHHVSVPRGTNGANPVSPCQGLGKPPAPETETAPASAPADAEGGAGGNTCVTPSLAEVIEWGKFDGVTEEVCRAFWEYHDGRNWMSGNTRIANPRRWLKGYDAEHGERIRARGKNKRGPGSERLDADELRAKLRTETDPQKKARIEEQLREACA